MRQDAEIDGWEAKDPVKNLMWRDAVRVLKRHGFRIRRKANHTTIWEHDDIGDNPPALNGCFKLTRPHAPSGEPNLRHTDVRTVVQAIRTVQAVQRENEERKDQK